MAGTEREPVDSQEREAGVAVQAEREHPALPGQDLSDIMYTCQAKDQMMILHRPGNEFTVNIICDINKM